MNILWSFSTWLDELLLMLVCFVELSSKGPMQYSQMPPWAERGAV